ncbi:RluA family pseudouridine synthase [Parafilimonas sp.]|uniref:RluA family pseudouridine synthase n=1 Tax=Parafilimonas sp. TaxID=1969739 RepID=UPI0039E29B28
MKFDTIFENGMLIAVNKPAGLLSIPGREGKEVSLKQMLADKYGEIFTVHRLDKNTSGVIVFAKNEAAHKALSGLFESRATEKIYYGLVHGSLSPQSGKIEEPIMQHPSGNGKMVLHIKGKPAFTEYETLEDFKRFSWVKFNILTGRTHQIRLHSRFIGHSIVCDDLYGDGSPVFLSSLKKKYNLGRNEMEERPVLSRLALHSASLKFTLDEEAFSFEAPLPKDLKALLQQLRKLNG